MDNETLKNLLFPNPADLGAPTNCLELSRQIIREKSNDFERTEFNATVSGFEGIYKCGIDGRRYQVHVKPIDK